MSADGSLGSSRKFERVITVVATLVFAVAFGVAAWAQLGVRRAPTVAGFEVVAYYYDGDGIGTTDFLFDAVDLAGKCLLSSRPGGPAAGSC